MKRPMISSRMDSMNGMLHPFEQARITREREEAQAFANWLTQNNRAARNRKVLKWGIAVFLGGLLLVRFYLGA